MTAQGFDNVNGKAGDGSRSSYISQRWHQLILQDGTVSRFNNVTLNLEPDNDANYVTTTTVHEEGNTVETRVYNGPTLDVKDSHPRTPTTCG